jgi:hypothetical protein
MHAQEQLIISAAHLAKSSPTSWAAFLQALVAYTEVHQVNLLKSPLPELPVNQGRAQAMSALLETCTNCAANADKIAQKGKPK